MTKHPNLVAWRKAHGSLCHVCPLNGQRCAGSDGPVEAEHIGVGDFPSQDDVDDGVTRGQTHGRAFSDGVGYYMKLENLVPEGLATLVHVPGRKWPRVVLSNTFLMNLIMCHIPGKKKPQVKIRSTVGRHAILCCANSYRAVMRRIYKDNPRRTLTTMGTAATSTTLRMPAAIEAFRGRIPAPWVDADIERLFAPIPEEQIYKVVLRGKHPKEPWWPAMEWFLAEILKLQRAGVRKVAKCGLTPPREFTATYEHIRIDTGEHYITNHAVVLDLLLRRQRQALTKRTKREKQDGN
jgi:hypothetical protein